MYVAITSPYPWDRGVTPRDLPFSRLLLPLLLFPDCSSPYLSPLLGCYKSANHRPPPSSSVVAAWLLHISQPLSYLFFVGCRCLAVADQPVFINNNNYYNNNRTAQEEQQINKNDNDNKISDKFSYNKINNNGNVSFSVCKL